MIVIHESDDKMVLLCPVCAEGEMEYQLQPPNKAKGLEKEVVLMGKG
jgi:hypothetical protein